MTNKLSKSTQAMLVALQGVLVQGNPGESRIKELAKEVVRTIDETISEKNQRNQLIEGRAKQQLTNDLLTLLTLSKGLGLEQRRELVNKFVKPAAEFIKKDLKRLFEYNAYNAGVQKDLSKIDKKINEVGGKGFKK